MLSESFKIAMSVLNTNSDQTFKPKNIFIKIQSHPHYHQTMLKSLDIRCQNSRNNPKMWNENHNKTKIKIHSRVRRGGDIDFGRKTETKKSCYLERVITEGNTNCHNK